MVDFCSLFYTIRKVFLSFSLSLCPSLFLKEQLNVLPINSGLSKDIQITRQNRVADVNAINISFLIKFHQKLSRIFLSPYSF